MNSVEVERRAGQTLWDVRDVAQYLKASVSWVYKAAERGELPCVRIGGLLRSMRGRCGRLHSGAQAHEAENGIGLPKARTRHVVPACEGCGGAVGRHRVDGADQD